jgi:P2-related tail formation protein
MQRLLNVKALAALTLLAGWLTFGPDTARAAFQIQIDGNNVGGTFSGFDPSNPNVFISSISGTSNSPGSPTTSQIMTTTVNIQSSANGQTVTINVGDLGFTQPLTGTLSSLVSGTVNVASATPGASMSVTSRAVNGNVQFPTSGGTTTPTQTFSFNTAGAFGPNTQSTAVSLTSPYSLGQNYTFLLNNATHVSFTVTTTITAPVNNVVPEPATLVGAFMGLASLGLVKLRRRK